VLSVGSAIMEPQVFERSISCVNNLRLQGGLGVLQDHTIFVVDTLDGGGWDWTKANRRNRALRITRGSARVILVWAGRCITFNATTSPSSATCITN
jgi:hypothetical protein